MLIYHIYTSGNDYGNTFTQVAFLQITLSTIYNKDYFKINIKKCDPIYMMIPNHLQTENGKNQSTFFIAKWYSSKGGSKIIALSVF